MNTTKLILALAAVAAAAVEDKPDSSPRSLRAKSPAAAIEAKLQQRVGRKPRMGGYFSPEPVGPLRVLIVDQRISQDTIFMTWADDGGEVVTKSTIFWEGKNMFQVYPGKGGYIYVSDGDLDTVFKLRDTDGDNVADEEHIWFSDANAEGFALLKPHGLWEVDDAVYIVNCGLGSRPEDAVYKTMDSNGDGDANDAGESSIWLGLSAVGPSPGPGDKSTPYTIEFVGDVAYVLDLFNLDRPRVYRAEDTNGDGTVDILDPTEFSIYLLIDWDLVSPFGHAMDGADVILNDGSGRGLYRYKVSGESVPTPELIWDPATAVRDVSIQGIGGFDIKVHNGEVWATQSFGPGNRVIRLVDKDGDGKFNSDGETIVWFGGPGDDPLERPRAVCAYGTD